jgi:PKHD-type hydroxylase
MYIFQPKKQTNYLKSCWFEGALDAGTCDAIISLFSNKPVVAGVHASGEESSVRKADITWIHYNNKLKPLFDLLYKFIDQVNSTHYNFQLSGMYEALQLARYSEGGHYDWHEDNQEDEFTTRKLSMVIQLQDPTLYEGGDLVIFPNTIVPRVRGTITFFPSFVTHKVTPVTKGERYSLVSWVTGHPFR